MEKGTLGDLLNQYHRRPDAIAARYPMFFRDYGEAFEELIRQRDAMKEACEQLAKPPSGSQVEVNFAAWEACRGALCNV